MLIAIPSEAPGGLDAPISAHFGHCHAFTLVELDGSALGAVTVLANEGHAEVCCLSPVNLLKEHGVEVLIAGGMGMRPLAGFKQVGIRVFFKEDAATVRDAAERMATGGCREFGDEHTCGGGGGGCGGHGHDHEHGHDHHHRQPVERVPIEGTADIRDGRVVAFHYKLTDKEGTLIDSSEGNEPLSYLHGHGNIVPGLERALGGLVVGDQKVVEVPAAEAYGERDDDKIVELPRAQLPPGAKVGAVLRAQQGDGTAVLLTIVGLDDTTARLDANHPLAGTDLVFDVTVVSVEAATAEELAHGHPH